MISRGVVLQPEASIDVEPDATTLYDLSRYGNDGTFTNSPTWVQEPTGLWVMNFVAASSQYITITDNVSLDPPHGYTIAAWINPNTISGNAGIVNKGDLDATGAGYTIRQTDAQVVGYLYNAAGNRCLLSTGNVLAANTWLFALVTADGSNGYLYVNGVQAVTAACVGIKHDVLNLSIARVKTYNYFDGNIGGLLILSYALSAGQVLQHYQTTKHLFGVHD